MVSLIALILAILGLIFTTTGNVSYDGWTIASYCISMLFYLLVIFGAIRYHRCAVIISLIWQFIWLIIAIWRIAVFDWSSSVEGDQKTADIAGVTVWLIWYLVVIYSLGTFVREVSSGVMSPATHSREKYSCCCNV